ncbi:hypothetical protein OIDMADRAFT_131185 [Oidiodendron maius Zn]|uniref:Enoyl reductase (ER) domain-containing protein n=1 Tax=Oidiodendron maius (strain Zn) TaxID=913774 RepID=A0A0C3H2U9_OIDMZ|nr:hypothetical protein OIDMADRAFT_131185 [Oidiodendron maius Zn]
MAGLPPSYKAAVVETPGAAITIKDVPLRHPGRGEVLIKVLACGICHSDAFVQEGNMGNAFPNTPGHEIVGDIAAVGDGEKKFAVGDRVGAGWHGGHDGICRECHRAEFHLCANREINGLTRNGGYAQYCILRSEAVARVPADLDPANVAPILCAGITTFNGIRKMNISAGDVVAIQGIGGLGHLGIQYARKMGFKTVAISNSSHKESLAKQLGAHHYINSSSQDVAAELQKIGGASLIMLTGPSAQSAGILMKGLAPKGKMLLLAIAGDVSIDTADLVLGSTSVGGWYSGSAIDMEEALEFARINYVEASIQKYPFHDAQKALDDMLAGKSQFRNVIVME